MSLTNPTTGKVFYTIPEYCEILGYHQVYVRTIINKGKIEGAFKRRGTWFIPAETIEKKLKEDPIYGTDEVELPEPLTEQPLDLDVTDEDLTDLLNDPLYGL